jgi:hypothetical protein
MNPCVALTFVARKCTMASKASLRTAERWLWYADCVKMNPTAMDDAQCAATTYTRAFD